MGGASKMLVVPEIKVRIEDARMDLTFEEAYGELEQVVARLEAGATTLDEALGLYERGTVLSQHCAALLEQAELRVNQLRDREDGEIDEIPFELG